MNKYIDAEKLKAEIERQIKEDKNSLTEETNLYYGTRQQVRSTILRIIDSLQQDDTQVDKMLCSQTWWEEQGWIMIPPDATIKGIDSLLKQVRKKLQQEQPDVDLEKASRHVYESWIWGTMDDVRQDMVELGKVLKARKEG